MRHLFLSLTIFSYFTTIWRTNINITSFLLWVKNSFWSFVLLLIAKALHFLMKAKKKSLSVYWMTLTQLTYIRWNLWKIKSLNFHMTFISWIMKFSNSRWNKRIAYMIMTRLFMINWKTIFAMEACWIRLIVFTAMNPSSTFTKSWLLLKFKLLST